MIAGIILSAGESKRMGQPKAILQIDNKTCLELIMEKCSSANIDKIFVVLGYAKDEILKKINFKNTQIVINENYTMGQTSSLKSALKCLKDDCEAFLLFPVDIPLIKVVTINSIIQQWKQSQKEIVVPTFYGRRGHPPIFSKNIFPEFLELKDSEPAHTVLRRDKNRVFDFKVNDDAIVMKMNTREEFEQVLEKYRYAEKNS